MRHRFLALLGVLAVVIVFVSLALVPVAGQALTAAANAKTTAKAKAWTPSRTPDGQPDLQGIWANNNVTPLERPKELADRQFLTDAEVAVLKERAGQLFSGAGDAAFGDSVFQALVAAAKEFKSKDGKTGDYNHFWVVERDFDNRTSLIVDPPDGKLPPVTEEAQKKIAARRGRVGGGVRTETDENVISAGRADSWEDRSLSERCITFGVPRLGAGYNSYYQILQSPGYVVIAMETIHDARVIPLDGRPHLPQNVRQWLGDSRGHWEGNTLVVDTTNFSSKSNFMGSAENLHVIERFTRVGANTINYEITVNDPTTWTKPWTAMIPLKQSQDAIYEYACHEGNVGLYGILAGARADEKATEAAKKGSR